MIKTNIVINILDTDSIDIIKGIDPGDVAPILRRFGIEYIKPEDAVYVHLIHTDPDQYGIKDEMGLVDVFAVDIPSNYDKHVFAVYIHMATAIKRLILYAEKNGNGLVIPTTPNSLQQKENSNENLVLIGVYSEKGKGGKFTISFKDSTAILMSSIQHVVKPKL